MAQRLVKDSVGRKDSTSLTYGSDISMSSGHRDIRSRAKLSHSVAFAWHSSMSLRHSRPRPGYEINPYEPDHFDRSGPILGEASIPQIDWAEQTCDSSAQCSWQGRAFRGGLSWFSPNGWITVICYLLRPSISSASGISMPPDRRQA